MTDGMIWAIIIGGFIVCLAFVFNLFDVVERRDMRDYRERNVYSRQLDFMKADIEHLKLRVKMMERGKDE